SRMISRSESLPITMATRGLGIVQKVTWRSVPPSPPALWNQSLACGIPHDPTTQGAPHCGGNKQRNNKTELARSQEKNAIGRACAMRRKTYRPGKLLKTWKMQIRGRASL